MPTSDPIHSTDFAVVSATCTLASCASLSHIPSACFPFLHGTASINKISIDAWHLQDRPDRTFPDSVRRSSASPLYITGRLPLQCSRRPALTRWIISNDRIQRPQDEHADLLCVLALAFLPGTIIIVQITFDRFLGRLHIKRLDRVAPCHKAANNP